MRVFDPWERAGLTYEQGCFLLRVNAGMGACRFSGRQLAMVRVLEKAGLVEVVGNARLVRMTRAGSRVVESAKKGSGA